VPYPERLSRRSHGYRRLGSATPDAVLGQARAGAGADEQALGAVFDGADAVLTPVFTRRPARVRAYEGRPALWTFVSSVRWVPFCGAFNHTGQPAASIPAAWTADGFPVGAQLVVRRDGEPLLLSLAAQLERALGWLDRRPPL
jgi:amidase